ncbi:MAG: ATP-binding cassette domain-containing protein [Acidimicrobiaceae bacterium]|nr:ATP-binding cassette domain-containing protein [Acidimicrobiaceae bacterium]
MSIAIEADELVKVFKGGIRAVDGLSLEVEAGTVFGLLGPNGAGKTTVVRILTTVFLPDSGKASVLGHDVVTDAEAVRANIGLAGQFAAVDENLTGLENLRMIGQLTRLGRKSAIERAAELLELFELADAAKRIAKTYSGGMRRRLDLAAALLHKPAVLFLDEPTSGLDPYSRQALWGVIEELVNEGTTVLLTTQYLEEADRLAKVLAVVDHGKVIAHGTPGELKATLGSTVIDLEMANNDAASRVSQLLVEKTGKQARLVGASVELPLEHGPSQVRELLEMMEAADLMPHRLNLREPSLDDVFLTLTGHMAEEPQEGVSK